METFTCKFRETIYDDYNTIYEGIHGITSIKWIDNYGLIYPYDILITLTNENELHLEFSNLHIRDNLFKTLFSLIK